MAVAELVGEIVASRALASGADESGDEAFDARLVALQQELSKQLPRNLPEAMVLAAELTYLLEHELVDGQRLAALARSLRNGLMVLSQLELIEFEGGVPVGSLRTAV